MYHTNLTTKELALLSAIDNSEYGDSLSDAVWTFSIEYTIDGVDKPSLGGIFSSLVKKGLIGTQEDGDDSVVWMTDKGIEQYVAAVGEGNVFKIIA